MAKYIDMVAVTHGSAPDARIYLFIAPAWSGLEAGDDVMVETALGLAHAMVRACMTVGVGSPEYEFYKTVCRAYEPIKRVVSQVFYRKFEYEEDEHESDNDGE